MRDINILVLILCIIFLSACSKDGAKSHLMQGASAANPANPSDPKPTDTNFPPPDAH